MNETIKTTAQGVAAAGGTALAAATRGVAALRPSAKPLHPAGTVLTGRLQRLGTGVLHPTQVPWIDEAGEDEVVVRLSKAIGLPDGVPDIHGLAMRVPTDDGPADLLFATTGTSRIGRFVLLPSRGPQTRPMSTLLPYRSPSGPLLLLADHQSDDTVELSWARPKSDWHQFAVLHLGEPHGDPQISFDPLLHQMPGLDQYPVVRRLREPSYLWARRSRR
ncbi:hypothetical protein [Nocardioides sp. Kera G14]|uniref:hypothetical protein n=1 Tax=Nocardioides sp. Kera G14 TaxID=2884264 RepID=UPI001D12178E|nr:hypothetical protein [Nocardioides sp. Kera G14]UDY22949.1 hypothetical protein LH076_12865 [Nocardioides sp. Kera G14]